MTKVLPEGTVLGVINPVILKLLSQNDHTLYVGSSHIGIIKPMFTKTGVEYSQIFVNGEWLAVKITAEALLNVLDMPLTDLVITKS